MSAVSSLFLRGFVLVTLTASNVGMIAGRHYVGAFVGGTLISVVWWLNARHSSQADVQTAPIWYGFGAGCGTLTGMAIVKWLFG